MQQVGKVGGFCSFPQSSYWHAVTVPQLTHNHFFPKFGVQSFYNMMLYSTDTHNAVQKQKQNKQTNSVALSAQENYTD
jgi:hypothetical protein